MTRPSTSPPSTSAPSTTSPTTPRPSMPRSSMGMASRTWRTIAGLALLLGAGWAGTAVTAGLLLQAFSCATCDPDVAGLLSGTGVLLVILALGGLGLYLVVTAMVGRTDPRVGLMTATATAAVVPLGLLVVALDSTGLEPIVGPLVAMTIVLLVVAGLAAARTRRPGLRPVSAGAAAVLVLAVLGVLTAM